MYGYGPPLNPRDWIEAMKDFEEWQEQKDKKNKEKSKTGDKKKGFSTMEIFLLLTLSSPVIGPLYLYAVIAGAKHVAEMLQAIH